MNYKITIFKNGVQDADLCSFIFETKLIRNFLKKHHDGKIDLTIINPDENNPLEFLYKIDKNININKIINKKILINSLENGLDETDKIEILFDKVKNSKKKLLKNFLLFMKIMNSTIKNLYQKMKI